MDNEGTNNQNVAPVEEKGCPAWGILGFFLPFIGVILLIVWLCTNKKKDAKYVGIGILIRVVLTIILVIAFFSFIIRIVNNPSKFESWANNLACMEYGSEYEYQYDEELGHTCYNSKTGDRKTIDLGDGYISINETIDNNEDDDYFDQEDYNLEDSNFD